MFRNWVAFSHQQISHLLTLFRYFGSLPPTVMAPTGLIPSTAASSIDSKLAVAILSTFAGTVYSLPKYVIFRFHLFRFRSFCLLFCSPEVLSALLHAAKPTLKTVTIPKVNNFLFIFICLLSNFQTIFSIEFNYMNLIPYIYFIRLIILSRTHSRSLP